MDTVRLKHEFGKIDSLAEELVSLGRVRTDLMRSYYNFWTSANTDHERAIYERSLCIVLRGHISLMEIIAIEDLPRLITGLQAHAQELRQLLEEEDNTQPKEAPSGS